MVHNLFAQLKGLEPKPAVAEVVKIAGTVRFPTKFLHEVLARYRIEVTEGLSHTTPGREIFINEKLMANLEKFGQKKIDLNKDVVKAISKLYHEATHAYILWKLQNPKSSGTYRLLIVPMVLHYDKYGKLEGGKKIQSSFRVVQEAFAEYVGVCTYAWWWSLVDLVKLRESIREFAEDNLNAGLSSEEKKLASEILDLYRDWLNNTKQFYSKLLLQKNHGYDEIDGQQFHSVTATPLPIKLFCHHKLLEEAVPTFFPTYPHEMLVHHIQLYARQIKQAL